MKLNPEIIAEQIQALRVLYPELPEDDEGWQLSIESETDLKDYLYWLEEKRQNDSDLLDALQERKGKLLARMERLEKREKMKRQIAFKLMQAANTTKIELPDATYSIRAVQPSVIILQEDKLPDEAFKIIKTPDKTKLKAMLKDGPVAGATMSNGGSTLAIRT